MKKLDINAIVMEAREIELKEANLRKSILTGLIELINANGGEIEVTVKPESTYFDKLAKLRYDRVKNYIQFQSSSKYTQGTWEVLRERSIVILAAIYRAAEKSINK